MLQRNVIATEHHFNYLAQQPPEQAKLCFGHSRTAAPGIWCDKVSPQDLFT